MVKKRVIRRTKKNFWKTNYKQSWNYLGESRNFILCILAIFIVFSLIGFLTTPSPEMKKIILDLIKELLKQTEGMNTYQLIQFIFLNNTWTSFMGLFGGIVLGLFSIVTGLANGYVLGFVAQLAVVESGGAGVLWRLVPHGIFELPAIFISLGLGIKLGSFIFRKEKIISLRYFLVNSFRVFVFVVIPLLIVAAVIEGCLIAVVG